MNTFDYPENNITDSNYNMVLAQLNQTSPDIIQGLQLETCDLQVFLSQVRVIYLFCLFHGITTVFNLIEVWSNSVSHK